MKNTNKKNVYLLVILSVITLYGFLVRVEFAKIGDFWFDEVNGIRIASTSLTEIWNLLKYEFSPPFYYYLLHFWMVIFGKSEYVLRLLGIYFGTLAIPLSYFVSFGLFRNIKIGVLTSALLATSPFFIFQSSDARMYPLLVFLGLIQFYSFMRLQEKVSTPHQILFTVSSVLAFYTHYSFVLFFFAEAIILAAILVKVRSKRKELLSNFFQPFLVIAFLAAVLFLTLSRYQIHRIIGTSLGYTSVYKTYSLVEYFVASLSTLNFNSHEFGTIYVWLYQITIIFGMVLMFIKRRKANYSKWFKSTTLLVLFFVPASMLYLASSVTETIRYISLSGLILLILIPYLIYEYISVKKLSIFAVFATAFLVMNTFGALRLYYIKQVDPRYHFRTITNTVTGSYQKGDGVLIIPPVGKILLQNYSKGKDLTYIDFLPSYRTECSVDDKILISFGGMSDIVNHSNISLLKGCLKNYNRVWFIYFDSSSDRYNYVFQELLQYYSHVKAYRWSEVYQQLKEKDSSIFLYLFST